MKTLLRWLSHIWPLCILVIIESVLVATNYKPATWLMGWDNVMPEFNFLQALKTNIYGVWMEYRGVGLPDGMGHAANLVHTLFLWLLSFALPQNTLRYAFQFLMHVTGMAGMHVLLKQYRKSTYVSVLGALFYGLNLITIQMFYTPLEAFSVHFAALPWLAYSLIAYLQRPSRNRLLLFISISILSTPQFFIPTLILPTVIVLGGISLSHIRRWKYVCIAAALFICANSYWALPYLYNLPYNAPIIQNAKINQMSSQEVYARNQVFGDLPHVLTMKGFMLDFQDVNVEGQPVFVMNTWRNWLTQPSVYAIGFLFAGFIMLGIWRSSWITGTWLVSLVILANNTPGISTIMNVFRDHSSLFAEAYRFPFTKFGLLFGFTGTLLAITGFTRLVDLIRKTLKPGVESTMAVCISFVICVAALLLQALPAFQGNLFYDALRVPFPKDYIRLYAFMSTQDQNGRTAYVPQPTYWSWKHYNYGYIGSGFLWYGLSQPLLDRAFDPWSSTNEHYYQELSYALYSKNADRLHSVLTKYDIRYVIFDGTLTSPGNNRALIPEETKNMLAALPSVKQIGTFGSLVVYENADVHTFQFIQTTDAFPASSPIIPTYAGMTDTEPVYSSTNSVVFIPEAVKSCGVLKTGIVRANMTAEGSLRIDAQDQQACLSFGIPTLAHTNAYRVAVTWRHILGQPMLFSLINNTDKHIETESLLESPDDAWHTRTFVLPPLAPDGMGYTVYVSANGIGQTHSINELKSVEFSILPNQETVTTVQHEDTSKTLAVAHPNPAFYIVTTKPAHALTLSQAYNPNWFAFDMTTGKPLTGHSMVNSWENGWKLDPSTKTIGIIFLPQLLEYLGFALLTSGVLILAVAYRRVLILNKTAR